MVRFYRTLKKADQNLNPERKMLDLLLTLQNIEAKRKLIETTKPLCEFQQSLND